MEIIEEVGIVGNKKKWLKRLYSNIVFIYKFHQNEQYYARSFALVSQRMSNLIIINLNVYFDHWLARYSICSAYKR